MWKVEEILMEVTAKMYGNQIKFDSKIYYINHWVKVCQKLVTLPYPAVSALEHLANMHSTHTIMRLAKRLLTAKRAQYFTGDNLLHAKWLFSRCCCGSWPLRCVRQGSANKVAFKTKFVLWHTSQESTSQTGFRAGKRIQGGCHFGLEQTRDGDLTGRFM